MNSRKMTLVHLINEKKRSRQYFSTTSALWSDFRPVPIEQQRINYIFSNLCESSTSNSFEFVTYGMTFRYPESGIKEIWLMSDDYVVRPNIA